jgi:hypothetical protein
MPLELSVPYADKQKAKNLGAFWLPERKVWVVPDHITDMNPFHQWLVYQNGCIIRKPYLLCLSKTNCWKCSKETPMIALGAKNYHAFDEGLWMKMKEPTLFSWVLGMSPIIGNWLHQHQPSFKLMYSHTIKSSYFANTCITCGRLLGDYFHHEEPGGAFFPDPYTTKPITANFKNFDLDFDYHLMANHGSMAYDDLFFPENKTQLAKHGIRIHISK